MTDLTPNLPDLLAALPGSPAGRDAAELVEAVYETTTQEEMDAALDRVVSQWSTT